MNKLLLIEDDPAESRMYERLFITAGFDVYVLPTGEQSLEAAVYFHPDVIVLDLFMPKVNGMEALDALHFSEVTKHIPVIMLTNIADSQKERDAMRRGACRFITKCTIENSDLVKEVLACIHDNV